ncbi:MAG: response regulator, partial [Deltaproteobacteria bacterium]|nr:response regulator [Deltaproteobacteria bacterium]
MVRILVIDDDPVILEVITKILKTNSYEVIAAPNGESGIKRLESNSFDLVLTDLMMPDVDGLEVLDRVVTKSPKTKCIILTGYGTIKSSVDAIKKGAFDYIAKPITS